MGGGDSDEESDEEDDQRLMIPYNNKTRGLFMIFSTLSCRRFFKRLQSYLREKDIVGNISETHW